MNVQEIAAILRVRKVNYPHFYRDITREDAEATIDLWASIFVNDEAKIVTEAVKALIVTNKYPPTIADVKEKIAILTCKNTYMTESEAWNVVYNAMRDSNYNAAERFESLPAFLKKLVGSPNQLREWALMPSETVQSVVQSNFMRSYKVVLARQKDYDTLPDSGKALIESLGLSKLLKGVD